MTSVYVALALLAAAAVTYAAPAPWLVAAPTPSHVADSDNTQAHESHYYALQFNALDYATSDMRQRGAAYLEGLRRSLENLLEPASGGSDSCDVIVVDSASIVTSASESNDTKTAEARAREHARACEVRRRAATSVRGAAALALHTARLLGEGRGALDPRREHQLIARLARLLDSLASTVGFSYTNTPTQSKNSPQQDAESSTISAASVPTQSPHYANASSQLVQEMIECLEQRPAADPRASYLRCPPSAAAPMARRRRNTGGLNEIEDPSQNLSDVSKAQPDRTITNDQAGAAVTRAQLEGHFQNPGLERTRRFGSNYQGNNLAITAVLRILSDV